MPFSPLDIAWHTMLWAGGAEFAALGLADGAAVTTWPDEISTHDATQATASKKPTYRATVAALNNKPAIEGDGTSDRMATAVFTALTQPCTLVAIGALTNAAVTTEKFFVSCQHTDNGTGPTLEIRDITGTDRWGYFAGSHQTAGVSDTNAHLHVAVFNGASSSHKLDGTVISTANPGVRVPKTVAVFAGATGDVLWTPIRLAFVALKSGLLTATELSDLESWAASEYEIPIARSDSDAGSGVDSQGVATVLIDADMGIGADAEAFGLFDGDTGVGIDGETIHQTAVRRIRAAGMEPSTAWGGREQSS